jgi:hypothetical protein
VSGQLHAPAPYVQTFKLKHPTAFKILVSVLSKNKTVHTQLMHICKFVNVNFKATGAYLPSIKSICNAKCEK